MLFVFHVHRRTFDQNMESVMPQLEKTVHPADGMELSAFQTHKVYPQNSGGCDLSGNCSRNGIILAGKAPGAFSGTQGRNL